MEFRLERGSQRVQVQVTCHITLQEIQAWGVFIREVYVSIHFYNIHDSLNYLEFAAFPVEISKIGV